MNSATFMQPLYVLDYMKEKVLPELQETRKLFGTDGTIQEMVESIFSFFERPSDDGTSSGEERSITSLLQVLLIWISCGTRCCLYRCFHYPLLLCRARPPDWNFFEESLKSTGFDLSDKPDVSPEHVYEDVADFLVTDLSDSDESTSGTTEVTESYLCETTRIDVDVAEKFDHSFESSEGDHKAVPEADSAMIVATRDGATSSGEHREATGELALVESDLYCTVEQRFFSH